eukprot:4351232-Amphidinium_carterae.1
MVKPFVDVGRASFPTASFAGIDRLARIGGSSLCAPQVCAHTTIKLKRRPAPQANSPLGLAMTVDPNGGEVAFPGGPYSPNINYY